MAEWKKVLVSGSQVHIKSITSSQVPPGGASDDVLVLGAGGEFKKVTQGSIQGQTTASFSIIGDSGTVPIFDATEDTLIITGSNGVSTTITETGDTPNVATLTINLPAGTISQSSQITLADTIGFNDYTSSLSASIALNATTASVLTTTASLFADLLEGLVASESLLRTDSGNIAQTIANNNTSITNLQTSVTALNDFTGSAVVNSDTGSLVISASVLGTTDQVTVDGHEAQGLTFGLPNDVTISGIIEADQFVISGEELVDGEAAIISGSTQFGNDSGDLHVFTGSLAITGGLVIDNGSNVVSIKSLNGSNTAGVEDIVVRDATSGELFKAGSSIGTAITGAFDSYSSSLAQSIANLNTSLVTTNASDIDDLQEISESLSLSASAGIHFSASSNGSSIPLGGTASFNASGTGLAVSYDSTGPNPTINYAIDATEIGAAIGAFSSSTQLQNELDSFYVQLSDAPVSGAEQLQALGFITASDFNQLVGTPSGLLSQSATGDSQGQIKINGVNVTINGLGTGGSPTFDNLTVQSNLTVKGSTTSLQVDNVNIEDQFILINSGADGDNDGQIEQNEQDGGIIVDNGGGSGSLLMYDSNRQVWGIVGATTASKVDFDTLSGETPVNPDVIVATVSASGDTPTDAPNYGAAESSFQKGQMHIKTTDSTIWIYV